MSIYRIATGISREYAQIHAQMGQDLYGGKPIEVMWDDWLAKRDVVPDFVFSAGYTICRRAVAEDLCSKFDGLSIATLAWSRNPKEECAKDLKRLKWLPKVAVDLCALFSQVELPILESSTVLYGLSGMTGENYIKKVEGASYMKGDRIVPRANGMGLYIDEEWIRDRHFFRAEKYSFLLCSEEVRDYILERRYTNIVFLEVGEVRR